MKKKNTVIIAEAGVNHNNSLSYAYKLIDVAIKNNPNNTQSINAIYSDTFSEISKMCVCDLSRFQTIKECIKRVMTFGGGHFQVLLFLR